MNKTEQFIDQENLFQMFMGETKLLTKSPTEINYQYFFI